MQYQFSTPQWVEKQENKFRMGGKNPQGTELYLNNLYLTRDGKPFYPVMGDMPITRGRRRYWEDRIQKMRAAGIRVMASYLYWIVHEFEEGKWDFSGDSDIAYFLELCQKHDMMVCLRIGPWITSEHRNGGLPDYIARSGKYKVRSNDPNYLEKVKIWYQKVYEQVGKFLYKNGGNIIMIQVENELQADPDHMLTLKRLAIEAGLEVPYYSATGWGRGGGAQLPDFEFLVMFGGYPEAPWDKHLHKRIPQAHFSFTRNRNSPDIVDQAIMNEDEMNPQTLDYDAYPNAWCELGVGSNTSKHRRGRIEAMDNYALAITKLGAGMNVIGYYIFAGGRNRIIQGTPMNLWCNPLRPKCNCYPIISYDFQAAIGCSGDVTPACRKLKLVNLFADTYGASLCEMQTVFAKERHDHVDLEHLRYALRLNRENSGYIFINNYVHAYEKKAISDVQFKMPDGRVIPEKGMKIAANSSCFFPYRVQYGDHLAEYITAQPITQWGNTYFFMALKEVEPVYQFEGMEAIHASVGKNQGFSLGGDTFVTLTEEEAEHLFLFRDGVYLGDGCDLVETEQGIDSCDYASYAYDRWEEGAFAHYQVKKDVELARASWEEIQDPGMDRTFFYELLQECGAGDGARNVENRQLKFYRVKVEGASGYVRIRYSGDSGQLYCDGELCDDNFFTGRDWIVQADYMDGKECVLVLSEYLHNLYVETEPKSACDLHEITVTAN